MASARRDCGRVRLSVNPVRLVRSLGVNVVKARPLTTDVTETDVLRPDW